MYIVAAIVPIRYRDKNAAFPSGISLRLDIGNKCLPGAELNQSFIFEPFRNLSVCNPMAAVTIERTIARLGDASIVNR